MVRQANAFLLLVLVLVLVGYVGWTSSSKQQQQQQQQQRGEDGAAALVTSNVVDDAEAGGQGTITDVGAEVIERARAGKGDEEGQLLQLGDQGEEDKERLPITSNLQQQDLVPKRPRWGHSSGGLNVVGADGAPLGKLVQQAARTSGGDSQPAAGGLSLPTKPLVVDKDRKLFKTEYPISIGFCMVLHGREVFPQLYTTLNMMYHKDRHVFFIHADAKMPEDDVAELRQLVRRVIERNEPELLMSDTLGTTWPIQVEQRISGKRFEYSLVEIDIICLDFMHGLEKQKDYVMFISGDAMPLAKRADIELYLSNVMPYSFISHKCNLLAPGKIAISRHLCNEGHLQRFQDFIDKDLVACLPEGNCRLEKKASWNENLNYVGLGWHWATLHRNFVDYIYKDELSKLSYWKSFFSNVNLFKTPDESFFQTLASMPGRPSNAPYVPYQLLLNLFMPWFRCTESENPAEVGHACSLDARSLRIAMHPLYQEKYQDVVIPFLFARKFTEVPCFLELYADTEICKALPPPAAARMAIPTWFPVRDA